jgi:hypothetical protein
MNEQGVGMAGEDLGEAKGRDSGEKAQCPELIPPDVM